LPIKPVHPLIARLPFFIAALFFLLAVISVQYDDITVDEPDHLQYGARILRLKSDRYVEGRDFNSTMPITALNALPRAVEQVFNPGLQRSDWGETDIKNGRYITILVSLVLLCYIFLFAKAIAGFSAGCWAMFLAALDPNLLAHGRLVTTDIYSALSFVMTFYHLYEWLINKKGNHFYWWCFAIAFAQCCKVNNILLYPICIAAIIAWRHASLKKADWKRLFIFIGFQLLVINLAFLFYRTGLPLADYHFKSSFFQQLQQGFLSQIPLPLPKSYIDTFDLVQYERESFDGVSMNYLLGELRYKRGFISYFIVCWALKTPLLTQLLLIGAVAYFLSRAEGRKRFLFFFLIPAIIILIFLSTSSVQTGYRYLLGLVGLTYVFAGVAIPALIAKHTAIARPLLIGISLLVVIFAFPNFIAYTNEFITDKKNAWRYIADSNLDWGQRQAQIKSYLQANPDIIFEPEKPVKGKILVRINKLVGTKDQAMYAWLRKDHEPVAVIESCYLLYQIR
jgi:hypothetical protein